MRTVTYFIQRDTGGPVKIGVTTDVAARLGQLQTSSPETLRVIALFDGNVEKQLHSRFRDKHIRGEWFRFDDDMEAYIRGRYACTMAGLEEGFRAQMVRSVDALRTIARHAVFVGGEHAERLLGEVDRLWGLCLAYPQSFPECEPDLVRAEEWDAAQEISDASSPVAAFVRDACVVGPGRRVSLDLIYDAWRQWLQYEECDLTHSKQSFGRELNAVLPGVKRRRGSGMVPFYEGIGLKHGKPEISDE